jgi:hypothetical protein
MSEQIRKFETGGTRDSDAGKLDWEGFFSPITLERYAQYMNKHRVMADGSLRSSDNWQKHFGEGHFSVCMKSLYRHFVDLWFLHRGYQRVDQKTGEEITKEEACCAILFNTLAYLDKLLKDKLADKDK